jgi:hypothetical protein
MSERLARPFHGDGEGLEFRQEAGTWRDEISGGDVSADGSPAAMSACGRRPAI